MKIAGHARVGGDKNLTPFAELRAVGYTGVETFCLSQWLSQPEAFRRLLRENEVTLAAMECGGDWIEPNHVAVERDCAERLIGFLKGVGASALIVSGGKRQLEGKSLADFHTLAGLLNDLGQNSSDNGLQLCYHPKPGTLIEYRDQIELILQLTNPETVSLCMDTFDLALSGNDPLEVAQSLGHRIGHIHLGDLDWLTCHRTAPGDGVLDLEGVLRELKAQKFEGWVTVESEVSENPSEEMKKSRQLLRGWGV